MIDLRLGDCMDILPTLPDNSVDAVVTDPPYELGFMGKHWDASGIAYSVAMWREVLRVLKPGGHVLSFGGSRTYHRMACAIEDAGFEVRDQIMWVYGSGFPKSHNLDGEWEGWGTALKPAHEPVCMARKPFTGTVADNAQRWGTGAINVDGCRVKHGEECRIMKPSLANIESPSEKCRQAGRREETLELKPAGRWPANLIHDGSEEVVGLFPEQKSPAQYARSTDDPTEYRSLTGTIRKKGDIVPGFGDSGSAARFFYCAKASRAERNAGCEELPEKSVKLPGKQTGYTPSTDTITDGYTGIRQNYHPTVKPVALMRYLCRLITPPGGVVLDPFTGSGTTGIAVINEGFSFIGIEREPEYFEIAKRRIEQAQRDYQPELLEALV